ncbi:MAG: type II secretion system F family protein [Acidobacteriaceae bacterium]
MAIVLYLSFGTTLFCGILWLWSQVFSEHTRSAKRVREVTSRAQATRQRKVGLASSWPRLMQRALRSVRVRIGMAEDDRLHQRLVSAGLRGSNALELYFAARMLGPVTAILLGSFIPSNTFFWAVALAAVAWLAPDMYLDRVIKRRRERIRRSIPDAVDLLVICVEAGLGMDQAMLRVGVELQISHPEVNEEFLQINREQRAGMPRMEAWQGMADRTKLPDIAAFTSMLAQTEKFGTPIARALSTFADGMRQKRRQRAEEMAAKTTVKMIFPLVLFIFPSMFIVLLAPAILSIGRGLAGLLH